ncbi:ScbR family autoregulator-binding transcription factor [Paenarthrobacter sp. NPDC018779]|uniref:ScbR family autoregulator-binding transcription factor n=1 Tax=Paenarthrobacter sp. NPDC018779 TaxID=3364375 RepID=UPI0037CC44D9
MVLQDRAKATREAIVAGAAIVFEERGFGSATIALVAEAAQVTKGALYFHFKSKDELAGAVLEAQHSIAMAAGGRILGEDKPALETIIRLCGAFGNLLVTDHIVRAGIRLTLEASAFGQEVRKPYQDWLDTMSHLTANGIRQGHIRASVDPADFSRYIVASFTGVQMVSNVLAGREDVMLRIQQMWEILLPGIIDENSGLNPAELSSLVSLESTKATEPARPLGQSA